jgi:hypothetical protein
MEFSVLKSRRRSKIVAKMRLTAIFLLKIVLELTTLQPSSLKYLTHKGGGKSDEQR